MITTEYTIWVARRIWGGANDRANALSLAARVGGFVTAAYFGQVVAVGDSAKVSS